MARFTVIRTTRNNNSEKVEIKRASRPCDNYLKAFDARNKYIDAIRKEWKANIETFPEMEIRGDSVIYVTLTDETRIIDYKLICS